MSRDLTTTATDYFNEGVGGSWSECEWPILICLLGRFRLLRGGRPIKTGGPKSESLLCTLALEPEHCAHRDRLLSSLWPDCNSTLASQSLNSLLYAQRKLLSPELDGASPVLHADGYYRLNMEAGIAIDMVLFEELVELGNRHVRANNPESAIASYTRASSLYRGELCASALDANSVVRREHFRALYLALLIHLAEYYFAQGDYPNCLSTAQSMLETDPYREDAHRMMMRCYLVQGARAQAFRQYQLCRQITIAEFGTEPEQATADLYNQIRLHPLNVLTPSQSSFSQISL